MSRTVLRPPPPSVPGAFVKILTALHQILTRVGNIVRDFFSPCGRFSGEYAPTPAPAVVLPPRQSRLPAENVARSPALVSLIVSPLHEKEDAQSELSAFLNSRRLSARSITSISTGPLCGSSFSPTCDATVAGSDPSAAALPSACLICIGDASGSANCTLKSYWPSSPL